MLTAEPVEPVATSARLGEIASGPSGLPVVTARIWVPSKTRQNRRVPSRPLLISVCPSALKTAPVLPDPCPGSVRTDVFDPIFQILIVVSVVNGGADPAAVASNPLFGENATELITSVFSARVCRS